MARLYKRASPVMASAEQGSSLLPHSSERRRGLPIFFLIGRMGRCPHRQCEMSSSELGGLLSRGSAFSGWFLFSSISPRYASACACAGSMTQLVFTQRGLGSRLTLCCFQSEIAHRPKWTLAFLFAAAAFTAASNSGYRFHVLPRPSALPAEHMAAAESGSCSRIMTEPRPAREEY